MEIRNSLQTSHIPSQFAKLYDSEMGAYVVTGKAEWMYLSIKFPEWQDGTLKCRLAISFCTTVQKGQLHVAAKQEEKEANTWASFSSGLINAQELMETGFLTESEAQRALDFLAKMADGKIDGVSLRLEATEDSVLVFDLREVFNPNKMIGDEMELAKAPVGINNFWIESWDLALKPQAGINSAWAKGAKGGYTLRAPKSSQAADAAPVAAMLDL